MLCNVSGGFEIEIEFLKIHICAVRISGGGITYRKRIGTFEIVKFTLNLITKIHQ